jgi:hypothetical protein
MSVGTKRVFAAFLPSLVALLIGIGLDGCAIAEHRIADTPRLTLHPSKGQIKMQARPGKAIGQIVPVNVAVANGTNEPYRIQTDQIFAISLQGRKVMPVPIGEAIKEVAHSNALRAEVTGAAKSALVGGIAGAAAGAAAGAVVGTIVASPAQGALLGAAVGGGVGAAGGGFIGGLKGRVSARDDAESQMRSLFLQAQDVNPNRSSDGYVFFPKGTYAAIEVNLLNEETEESASRRSSWETGEAQVPSTAPGFAHSPAAVADPSLHIPRPHADTLTGLRTLPPTRIE